jgi:hypothetical protein
MSESDKLADAVRRMYEINHLVVSISPEFLANGAMEFIGFHPSLHPTGWMGCNLYCRQLARAFCRRHFDPANEERIRQGDLFDGMLQDRYPRQPVNGQEPEYVLRAHLSEDDRWHNIDRMTAAASALLRHVDALRTETVKAFGPRKDRAA